MTIEPENTPEIAPPPVVVTTGPDVTVLSRSHHSLRWSYICELVESVGQSLFALEAFLITVAPQLAAVFPGQKWIFPVIMAVGKFCNAMQRRKDQHRVAVVNRTTTEATTPSV